MGKQHGAWPDRSRAPHQGHLSKGSGEESVGGTWEREAFHIDFNLADLNGLAEVDVRARHHELIRLHHFAPLPGDRRVALRATRRHNEL